MVCLVWAHGHPTHPLFCYVGVRGAAKGVGVLQGVVWGLCGVVDISDELLCFVDQGVAEESRTRQQHQHNTSMMKCGVMFVALDVHVAEV